MNLNLTKFTDYSLKSNTLSSRQKSRHFVDDIFKCISWRKCINFESNLTEYFPKGIFDNIPELMQKMAWRLPGDRPLTEPMTVILLMHVCVTWPQWVNDSMGNHLKYNKNSFAIQSYLESMIFPQYLSNFRLKNVNINRFFNWPIGVSDSRWLRNRYVSYAQACETSAGCLG